AFAFAADFFEQLDLDLLNLEQTIVLPPQEMVDFFVQMPDLELGVEIDFVIVLRAQTIAQLGAILTHHDHRRLDGGETRENQIEKNEWIRIERSGSEQRDVRTDPHDDNSAKCNEEFPTAAKLGEVVGESLAESQFLFELFLNIAGENLVLFQTFDDFLVERRKFSDLVLQDFFYIILPEVAQIVEADEPFAVQVGFFLLDELEKRWPNQLRDHSAVR